MIVGDSEKRPLSDQRAAKREAASETIRCEGEASFGRSEKEKKETAADVWTLRVSVLSVVKSVLSL